MYEILPGDDRMIDNRSIAEWLTDDPVGFMEKLAHKQTSAAELEIALKWEDDTTGNSILHALFAKLVLIELENIGDREDERIDKHHILYVMLKRLRDKDPSIINKTNNRGETPLGSVANLANDTIATPFKKYMIKRYATFIINYLIQFGGYCKIYGPNEKENKFLLDILNDDIPALNQEEYNRIRQQYFHHDDLSPIHLSRECFILFATNMLFREENISFFKVGGESRDFISLNIAVGHLKTYHPLMTIFKNCIAQGEHKQHFMRYIKNDVMYYKRKCFIAPNVLRDIQIILHIFYKNRREGENKLTPETIAQYQALVAEGKSAKDMLTALTNAQNINDLCIHTLHYLASIPRCFTEDHRSRFMGYIVDQILSIVEQKKSFSTLLNDHGYSIYAILSNAIVYNNNILFEKLVNKVSETHNFEAFVYRGYFEKKRNARCIVNVEVTPLIHVASQRNKHEPLQCMLDHGVSGNKIIPYQSAVVDVQSNPTPEMQKLFTKYCLCSSITMWVIKECLVNINRGLIFVGAVAATSFSALYFNNELAKSVFLSRSFIACGFLYCTTMLTLPYLAKHPEILPDTMAWIMRSAEKLWNGSERENR